MLMKRIAELAPLVLYYYFRRDRSRCRGISSFPSSGTACLQDLHLAGLKAFVACQLEETKAKAAEAEATAKKQRMLNIEKVKIKDIVRKAFAPLLANA